MDAPAAEKGIIFIVPAQFPAETNPFLREKQGVVGKK